MTKSPRSRFADAAGRLDRYVADLKARQFDATGATPIPLPVAPRGASTVHPDEAWRRNYATRSIRPQRPGESAAPMPDYAVPPPHRPQLSPEKIAEPVARNINAGHIGAGLGKPAKKRGVLARLFRGPDR